MQRLALALIVAVMLATPGLAQPKHGDLVLVLSDNATFGWGATVVLDPQTGTWTTLIGSSSNVYFGTARMAPNNTDVAIPVSRYRPPAWWPCELWHVSPTGTYTTAAVVADGAIEGFALDHDDTWLAVGQNWRNAVPSDVLWSIGDSSGIVSTLATQRGQFFPSFNDICVDRDPGASTYVIGVWNNSTTVSTPKLVAASRQGVATTLVAGVGDPLLGVTNVELDPTAGGYLVTDNNGPTNLSRVTAGGTITDLKTTIRLANAVRVNRDGTAWVAGHPQNGSVSVYKVAAGGAVLTIIPVTAYSSSAFGIMGLEVYGSRALVCNQISPATVEVHVKSHYPYPVMPAWYALAVSFARRPGIRFGNGGWLDLDATDPLFFVSAMNLAPGVFQNFQGTLFIGNAKATVSIPAVVRGLGLPVFVAGVLYNRAGVFQVTNTHWFVL